MTMILSETNGNWTFEGTGCGSLHFDGPGSFSAKAELVFSSDTGIDADVYLDETCLNNDNNASGSDSICDD